MYPDLNHLADTITAHEGGPGNINFKNNNPGNLVYAGQPGATKDERGFAVFQNADAGRQALVQQLGKYKNDHPNLTPEEFINGNGDFKGYSSDSAPGNAPGQAQAYADVLRKNATPLPPPAAPSSAPSSAQAPQTSSLEQGEKAAQNVEGMMTMGGRVPTAAGPFGSAIPGFARLLGGAFGFSEAKSRPEKYQAAAEAVRGAGQVANVPMLAAGAAAPLALATGLATSTLASKGAEKATKLAGGSPEAQQFAGEVGGWAPILAAAFHGGRAKSPVEVKPVEASEPISTPIQKPPTEAPPPLTLQAQPTQIPLPLTEAPVERRVSDTPINFANRRNLPIPEAQQAAFWDHVKGKPEGFSKGIRAQAAASSPAAPQESAPIAEPPRVAPPKATIPEAALEASSKVKQDTSSATSPSGVERNDSASVKAPLNPEDSLLSPREEYESLQLQLAKNETELQRARKQAALGNLKENAAEKFAPRGTRTQKNIDWMQGESDRLRSKIDQTTEKYIRTMSPTEAQTAHDSLRAKEEDFNRGADALDHLIKDDKLAGVIRVGLRYETLSKAQRQGSHDVLGDVYDTSASPSIARLRFAKGKEAKVSVAAAHQYIATELNKVGITSEHVEKFSEDLNDPRRFGKAVKGLETILPPGTDAKTIAKNMQILANKTPVVLNYPRYKGLAPNRLLEIDLRTARKVIGGIEGNKGSNVKLVQFTPEQKEQYNMLRQTDPNAAILMKKAAVRERFETFRDKARARAAEVGYRADQVAQIHGLEAKANRQAIDDLIHKRIRLNDKVSDTEAYVLSDRRLRSLITSPRTLGEVFEGADNVARARERIQSELTRRAQERTDAEAKRMEAIKAQVNPSAPAPEAKQPAGLLPATASSTFNKEAPTTELSDLERTAKIIPGFEKLPNEELVAKDRAANDEQLRLLQAEVEKGQHPSNTLFSGASMLSPRVVKAVFPKVSDYFADKGPSVKDIARKIVREQTGVAARAKAQLFDSLKEESKRWVGTSNAGLSQFTDAVESGNLEGLSKEDTKLVGTLREILDSRREAIRNLGTGKLEKFYENYFPHIWEHPSRARDIVQSVLQGRKPLQGSANFLKQRSISTISAGIAEGLKPVTTNPVELVLLKAHEMDRYLMAHKIFGAYKDEGLLQFVKLGQLRPDGFTKINDTLFRSLIPTKSGMILRGEWHAPEGAAKILNNYLSPGLRGNWAYDIFRGTTNTLNQVQLGFSAFHLGFTTLDSQVSDLALGLEQISRGKIAKGGYTAIRSFMPGLSVANNFAIGKGVIAEYLKPGSAAKYAQTAEMVGKAGGRIAIDPMYVNDSLKKLQEGFGRGDWKEVGKNVVPATVETIARPIMSTVAKVKLGVFHGLASDLMEQAREQGWDEFKIGSKMQEAWDSVDNRMGQMVYDNLFWNRTAKDLGMVSVRSLGWNLGTVREVAGGAKDIGTQFLKASTNNRAELTHRMAYLMALPAVVGFYGAMLNYAHTGEAPKELKDYFFPRTGKLTASGDPERLSLPSYMKDIYAWKHSPTQVAIHKLSPAIAMTADLIQNQDFYGNEIRHPEDSRVRQAVDTAKWAMTQATPFNIQGIIQRMKASGASNPFDPKTIAGTAESQVGITPAPAYVNRSTAAEMARGYAQRMESRGPFTKEQSAHIARVRDYESKMRGGQLTDEALYQAIQKGDLTENEAEQVGEIEAKQPRFIQDFKRISLPEALRVWDVMSPKEREATRDLLGDKEEQIKNYLPADQDRLGEQLDRAFWPSEKRPQPQP
jgi:hypothetical protein